MSKITKGIALAAAMLAAVVAVTAVADGSDAAVSDTVVDGIYYEVAADGSATVVGCTDALTVLDIPSTVQIGGQTYPVTSIKSEAFRENTKLVEVHIPESVTSVGWSAFAYCSSIEYLYIDGPTEFNSGVFSGCRSLNFISLGSDNLSMHSTSFNVGAECTVRGSEGVLDQGAGNTKFTYVSREQCLVRFDTVNEPQGITGFEDVLVTSGGALTLPDGASVEGYQVTMNVDGQPVGDSYQVSGDIIVTLTYTPIFTVTFMNGEDVFCTVQVVQGGTVTIPETEPTKDPTDTLTFTFSGWNGYTEGMKVTDDVIFQAQFTEQPRLYKIEFVDGETVVSSQDLEFGVAIVVPDTVPVREPTETTTFTFSGWGGYTEGMTVSADVTFQAKFDETLRLYKVQFVNGETVVSSQDLEFGAAITAPEEDPVKEQDEQYTYTFAGWEGYEEGMTVSADVTFQAKFDETLRQYTVTFVSEGVTVLEQPMDYGSAIVPPADPVKEQDAEHIYTFAGWEGYTADMTVTGDVTFTARFDVTDRLYTIRFVSDGTVFDEQKLKYGETITAPEQDPVREQDEQYSYTFAEWVGYTEGMEVSGDATFEARYNGTLRMYTITFVIDGKSESSQLAYGSTIKLPPAPDKEGYTFVGWEGYTEDMKITGDMTFTAQFESLEPVSEGGGTDWTLWAAVAAVVIIAVMVVLFLVMRKGI